MTLLRLLLVHAWNAALITCRDCGITAFRWEQWGAWIWAENGLRRLKMESRNISIIFSGAAPGQSGKKRRRRRQQTSHRSQRPVEKVWRKYYYGRLLVSMVTTLRVYQADKVEMCFTSFWWWTSYSVLCLSSVSIRISGTASILAPVTSRKKRYDLLHF